MGNEDKVANPYRAAIVGAKASSTGPAATLKKAFNKAGTAMDAGAWIGGKADQLAGSLKGWQTTSSSAAGDAMDEFDRAIKEQPEMVPANSWQVHWHNLRP